MWRANGQETSGHVVLEGPRISVWDLSTDFTGAGELQQLLRETGLFRLDTRRTSVDLRNGAPHSLPPHTHLLVLSIGSSVAEQGARSLRDLRHRGTRCPILVLTDAQGENVLLDFIQAGAADFLPIPLRRGEVLARLTRCLPPRSEAAIAHEILAQEFSMAQIIGQSDAIRAQIQKAERYAKCDLPVLISGETGTGKEVFARAVHYASLRSRHPFVAVNCGALPLDLIENELFGHESGAYTGAGRPHKGLISQAEGGTLFLDEIDSLPLSAQAKLLRFLQEREYCPLGSTRVHRADVRVISASNISLVEAVRGGRFRQDLYFRVGVLPLCLPALRERPEDIPLLANHFLRRNDNERRHKTPPHADGTTSRNFTQAAINLLMGYTWPGNARELENVVERALVLANHPTIDAGDLDIPYAGSPPEQTFKALKARVVFEFVHRYLEEQLARHQGNITRAARAAGTDRRAFFELLRKHHLTHPHDSHTSPRVS